MDGTKNIGNAKTSVKAKQLRRRGASLDKKKAKAGWWFILPFLVGFVTVYLPMIIGSVRASMMSSTGQNQKFVGFANYVSVLTEDANFTKTLVSGIQQLVFDIPAIVIFSLFMAVLLNQKMLGRAVFRAIFFVPVILGTGLIDQLDNSSNAALENMSSGSGADNGSTNSSASEIISQYDMAKIFEGMKIGTGLVEYVTDLVNKIYGIVHRIMAANHAKKRGAASFLMTYCAKLSLEAGVTSMRCDTHPGNIIMQHTLEKNGYIRCGIIHLTDGADRFAYEKVLK